MNSAYKSIVLLSVAVLLGACASAASMLNGKSRVPQPNNISVGNNLAMPPDLQLAVPGQTTDAYQPNVGTGSDGIYEDGSASSQKVAMSQVPPPAPVQDVYEKYGVSKINADGTPKTAAQLKKDLKAAILAKKRLTNPGYGSIRNIGAIFSDQ